VSTNKPLQEFARFLIRYHYPEYEYNHHFGGDDLPKQFFSDNPILSHHYIQANDPNRDPEPEDFLHDLFDLDNVHSPIELYCGHYKGTRLLFATPIKEEKSKLWDKYKQHIKTKNYFLIEEDAMKALDKIFNQFKIELPEGLFYYRARIGYKEIEKEITISSVKLKVPYTNSEIGAPPPLKATPGRANRQGVSFLYLASDKGTAIGEVRPHPGHYVSLGKFKGVQNLVLADLRFIDLSKFYHDKNALETFKLLRDLGDELSLAILPEEKENYLITQFISEIIRRLGLDGILFNSSVSDGHNLVVFNSDKFEYVDSDSELVKIMNVDFKYKLTEYHIDGFLEKAIEK
jgi:hypothetical protein